MDEPLSGQFMGFVQTNPQLSLALIVIGIVVIFFFINVIGGDKKD
ncbi:MAG: hypothetical protein V1822_01345 [Candidatus Micrarchaeota archaeon]